VSESENENEKGNLKSRGKATLVPRGYHINGFRQHVINSTRDMLLALVELSGDLFETVAKVTPRN
jgi:hypothetical protein